MLGLSKATNVKNAASLQLDCVLHNWRKQITFLTDRPQATF